MPTISPSKSSSPWKLDLTVNVATLLTGISVVVSMIVGFVRTDDRLNYHEQSIRELKQLQAEQHKTLGVIATNQAVLNAILERITEQK